MQRRVAAAEVTVVDSSPESDGLKSARELRALYLEKASWVERFTKQPATYYRNAAAALDKLIGDVAAHQTTVTFALAIPE